MTTDLANVLKAAEQLSEADQEELAAQIEERILHRKIAAGEASYACDGGVPLGEAFDGIRERFSVKYGS